MVGCAVTPTVTQSASRSRGHPTPCATVTANPSPRAPRPNARTTPPDSFNRQAKPPTFELPTQLPVAILSLFHTHHKTKRRSPRAWAAAEPARWIPPLPCPAPSPQSQSTSCPAPHPPHRAPRQPSVDTAAAPPVWTSSTCTPTDRLRVKGQTPPTTPAGYMNRNWRPALAAGWRVSESMSAKTPSSAGGAHNPPARPARDPLSITQPSRSSTHLCDELGLGVDVPVFARARRLLPVERARRQRARTQPVCGDLRHLGVHGYATTRGLPCSSSSALAGVENHPVRRRRDTNPSALAAYVVRRGRKGVCERQGPSDLFGDVIQHTDAGLPC